jgi:PPM family protein phosphatase
MSVHGRARARVYRLAQRFFPEFMSPKPFSFAMLSHPGRVRKGNEDMCAANPDTGAFIVCDGMGGAAAGEIASKMAADAFLAALAPHAAENNSPRPAAPDVRLDAAIHAANAVVFDQSRRNLHYHGMGTTLVALLLRPAPADAAPSLTLAHVGDSRCYLFREGVLTQLTRDHSLVEEHVRAGELTRTQAEQHPMRNIITRAVGTQADVEPEIRNLDPLPGDLYLLASDGLTRDLSDAEIAATLQRFQTCEAARKDASNAELSTLCQALIDQANDAGGGDNITVLALHLH